METTPSYMALAGDLSQHNRPAALYSDKRSIFRVRFSQRNQTKLEWLKCLNNDSAGENRVFIWRSIRDLASLYFG